jgi:hypothetical protein
MKRTSSQAAVLISVLLLSALPVFAGDGTGTTDQGQQVLKDECLLVAKNCGDSVDSIQQRIERISREISKGSAVYTKEELRRLNSQLNDTKTLLEEMTVGGS